MFDQVSKRAVFERYLTEDEERQLLRYVARFNTPLARRDHAWMRLLRQTGIRVGSLSGLTVGAATAALHSGRLALSDEHAKGQRGYQVPANSEAQRALRDLLKVRRALGFAPVPSEALIVTHRGAGMSVRSFQARMAQWREESGLPVHASPHWWRHTLAKRVMKRSTAQDPLGIVQAALGQASRQSAAIYALPDREEIAAALEEAR